MIRVERVYDHGKTHAHEKRFLVDRVWPRGVKKEELELDGWQRDAAPSTALRKWFGHDPERWDEFRRRYFAELDDVPEAWKPLAEAARSGRIVLLYGAKDTEHNQAIALKEYLERKRG